ncbi:MAG: ACT domain-containing protein [Lachnospiraceae bacterium]|nr:ACT domain-containing protein [Lachnospiraceae bacterium]
MALKQISVFLENKPGTLSEMTGALAAANIDMRALSLAETKDFGIARLIADDVYKASNALKDAGFVNSLTSVVGAMIPDEPGGLDKLLKIFHEANINLEYMYAFLGGDSVDHAYMIFRVGKEMEKEADAVLAAHGIRVLTQEDVNQI